MKKSRYNFYVPNDLDDYLCQLAQQKWHGHSDISKIILLIIREHRDHFIGADTKLKM